MAVFTVTLPVDLMKAWLTLRPRIVLFCKIVIVVVDCDQGTSIERGAHDATFHLLLV